MEVSELYLGLKILGKKQVYNKAMDAFEYQPCEGIVDGYRRRYGRIEVYFLGDDNLDHWNYLESIRKRIDLTKHIK